MPAAFSSRQAFSDSLKKVLVLYFINLFEPFELTHPNIVFTPFHLGKHLPAHGQAHDLELGSHLLLGQTRPVPEPPQILSDREVLPDFQFTVPLLLEWIPSILMLQYFCAIIGMYTFQFKKEGHGNVPSGFSIQRAFRRHRLYFLRGPFFFSEPIPASDSRISVPAPLGRHQRRSASAPSAC